MGDLDTFKKVQEKIKQNIYIPFVDKVYPHVVNNLGKSQYVNEIPPVM